MKALNKGDEIRIIAPSVSRQNNKDQILEDRALRRLTDLGYKVSFGKYLNSKTLLGSASVLQRISDFNDAYEDKNVKAVMALTGGWSANELLNKIDWSLIKRNPKPLIGYSDITVLINAIYAKTSTINYLGPNFSTLGRMTLWQYTIDNFDAALRQQKPINLEPSKSWSDLPSKKYITKPWKVIQKGDASGVLIGGNLGTFYLLQGTEYQPKFNVPFILLIEDDDESGKYTAREFARRLESILQLPNVRKYLRGIIIGRFQTASKVPMSTIIKIIDSKQLKRIPVVAGVDFGHTIPMLTLPIGGLVKISSTSKSVRLTIL
jgi:muramoyltetrapeptide carboxypeptidase LdcA involved in peptidoglycan recycling